MIKVNKQKRIMYIALAFVVTLFFALSGKYITTGYKIAVGQVSNTQLKANRDVENTVRTEKEKQQIISTTEPRYSIDKTINDSVNESIEDFFIIADEERALYNQYKVEHDGDVTGFKSSKLGTFLKTPEEVKTVLTATGEEYDKFKTGTKAIIQSTLETGVKESDIDKNKAYVSEQFNSLTANQNLNLVGIDIYDTFFKANLIVDEQATNQAIEDKIKQINPQIYLKGQTIVNDGDIITQEQYQMLKDLGYVDTSLSEKKWSMIGIGILVGCIFAVAMYFFSKFYSKRPLKSNEEDMLFVLYVLSVVLIWVSGSFAVYLSPILISVVLVSIFLGNNFGIFFTVVLTLLTSLIIGADLQYIIFILLSSSFATSIAKGILSRKNMYKVAIIFAAFNCIAYVGLIGLFTNKFAVDSLITVVYIALQAIITIIICFGIIPIFEMLFSIITPNKLLELSNPDNELLKRSTMEMPGTYHHSLVVANLSEVAANAVGADATLVRVAAYYHDIGKLMSPYHFSENQNGVNVHDKLDPIKSFEIITNHINYGIALATKHKLPKEIIDMIPEHHGNTLVNFFYIKAKNADPTNEEITEEMFRYNGPKPKTKESAILMLADTCEAAVRSRIVKVSDFKEVEDFVNTLINGKIEDGQLTECDITYGDVEKIKAAFMRVFKGMYHERVEYPKLIEEPKEVEKRTFGHKKAKLSIKAVEKTEEKIEEKTGE